MFWQLQQRNTKGRSAETLALKHLQSRGLKLIQKNYACRFGEIDLIMKDRETLVFIEVRFRTRSIYGGAGDTVTPAKIRKIQTTASHFLQTFPSHRHRLCRFDVITINAPRENPFGKNSNASTSSNNEMEKKNIEWLKGAFP